MVFILFITVPFMLFVGGSYILNYPLTLGVLYGFNVTLIYIILWMLSNQTLKVLSQRMCIVDGEIVLVRKQLCMSFPLYHRSDLEIPVNSVKEINLTRTQVGYSMNVRFDQEGKTMGVDMDINPLRMKNLEVIRRMMAENPDIGVDHETSLVLNDYEKSIGSWKRNYVFSFTVVGISLAVFFLVSVFLGTVVH